MLASSSDVLRQRIVGLTLGLALLSGGCRRDEGVWRVGILNTAPRVAGATAALRQTLVETSARRPWAVEFFELGPVTDDEALPAAAARLVDSGVDVIVAVTTAAAMAAKRAVGSREVPIVFCLVSDPVGAGLVRNPLHPVDGITGVVDTGAVLAGKRLEVLARAQPGVRRVLVVHGSNPASRAIVAKLRAAAAKLELELVALEADNEPDVANAYRSVAPGKVDAVYVPSDTVVRMGERALEDLVKRDRIPAIMGGNAAPAAVFGYGTTPEESGAQAAVMVSKIFDGIPSTELPVESARRARLRLFPGHARELGYTFSDAAWWLADEIVDE